MLGTEISFVFEVAWFESCPLVNSQQGKFDSVSLCL